MMLLQINVLPSAPLQIARGQMKVVQTREIQAENPISAVARTEMDVSQKPFSSVKMENCTMFQQKDVLHSVAAQLAQELMNFL